MRVTVELVINVEDKKAFREWAKERFESQGWNDMAKQKRKTNSQFIKALMEGEIKDFRMSSVLVQIFVMDALMKQAEKVAALTDAELQESFKNSFVDGPSWRETGREIKKALEEFYAN